MEKKTASATADTPAATATAPTATNPAPADGNAPAPAPVENTIRVEGVLDIDLQRGGNGQLIDIGRGISRFNKAQVPIVNGPGRHPPSGSMFLYYLDPDGITVEYSFGMEEFPAEGARKPRVMEPIKASIDYWDSFLDPRKATVGAIERMDAAPAQIAAE